jgi:glutathione S-transferase
MRDGVAIGEFPKGATHYQQMRARPGVQQAL